MRPTAITTVVAVAASTRKREHQVYGNALDRDALQGVTPARMGPVIAPGRERQAGGLGGFELRSQRGPHAGGGGLSGGLVEPEAGFELKIASRPAGLAPADQPSTSNGL